MTEPDPAKPPPLTCANDLASTAGSLAIVVSNLSSELHMLRRSYDLLSGEFTRTQNLLEAVMAAHRLGSTDEAWRVERQLEQDLNECVNSNIDLLQRLHNQNLVIASLRQKNDAYERKNGVVGGKDLNALLYLALHSCQIGNSILYFHEYITAYECKASNAEDVTNKDESIGWGRKRD
jgi:hypothetical protein